jgi:hypothetical protein
MTNAKYYLQKVKEFRDACGIHQIDNELHLNLLNEESMKLALAAAKNDIDQVADAFADLVVVYTGWQIDAEPPIEYECWLNIMEDKARKAGINLRGTFDLVHESNMTKLCSTEEIQPTIDKYKSLGVELEWREVGDGLWSAHAANDTEHAPRHKLLKPTSYKKPDWSKREQWELNSAA